MNYEVLQDVVFIIVLVGLSVPLGLYINKVMTGQKVFLSRILLPVEKWFYKLMGVGENTEMGAKQYAGSVLVFSFFSFLAVFLVQLLQGILPLNPEGFGGVKWDLAFNTAASFASNTNWQAYSGETSLSYFTQMTALTVQNFLSAAVGVAVLFALIRGFILKKEKTIGNFWHDLTRVVLYVLLPLSLILAVILVSQGVVQTFGSYKEVTSLQDGIKQVIALGPAASQIAIKQLGTNGGGFFGVNSAFPLENPTMLSNFLQILSILLIPAALCISFGKAVKDKRQGRAIYIVMIIFFVVALCAITMSEQYTAPVFDGVMQSGNIAVSYTHLRAHETDS